MGAALKGAIVLTQPAMTNFVRKDRPQPSDPNYTPMSAAYATGIARPAAPAAEETPQQRAHLRPAPDPRKQLVLTRIHSCYSRSRAHGGPGCCTR